jgi:enoyl-CoA hydratase/carnithine racemase
MAEVEVEVMDRLAVLTINRPESRNAIGLRTIGELENCLDDIFSSTVEVLVVTGSGERAFVSGGDLRELATLLDFDAAKSMATRMRRVLDRLAECKVPVIAALNGHALGGGAEVAIAADIRIAASDVRIGFNQVRLGIIPAWGGTERLAEVVGRSKALMLVATGQIIGAADAERMGLVDLVVDRTEFEVAWRTMARAIADLASGSGRSIKRAVGASRPNSHRHSEDEAVTDFARLWIADAHWQAVEAMQTDGGRKPSPPS